MPRKRTGSTLADLRRFAERLPEVGTGTSWGAEAYTVRGKAFVIFRTPRPDALDEHGERLTDVIVLSTPDLEAKEALVADAGTPFFTTPHFDRYAGVLVRAAHLGQVPPDELEEVVVDAWLARAPKRLAKQWLADQGVDD
jgi:hypothetical protein